MKKHPLFVYDLLAPIPYLEPALTIPYYHHDALVDRLLGIVETMQRNWTQARKSLEAAEAVARRYQMKLELAHTLQAQVDLQLAQPSQADSTRVIDLLNEVIALYRELGLTEREKKARGQLEQLTGSPKRTYPAGLTEREVDVLRSVALGQSNKQIAKQLFLSEKTVGNHITSIFHKIGAENRAAATAFAIRNKLTE